MSQPSLARRFARFAAGADPLPDEVLAAADRACLDTLGAMIAGGAHPAVRRLAAAQPLAAGPASLATGGSGAAETAALINAMAGHVWDIDDACYAGVMHGSTIVLPACLALAEERGADAETLRRAFVVGSEIAYALGESVALLHQPRK